MRRLFKDYPALQLLDSEHEEDSDTENSLNVVHITSQTIMILSQQKVRHWNFKLVSVLHIIYK